MKERPILFNGPMVRAIIDGTKTQTRRMVKPQPQPNGGKGFHPVAPYQNPYGQWAWVLEATGHGSGGNLFSSPYGQPGDRLWVRQEHYRFGHWEPVPGLRTKGNRQKWKFVADTDETRYEAPDEYRKGRHHKDPTTPAWHKRLARFMPRRLSVIDLLNTSVRVERLNDISEEDALAEGCTSTAIVHEDGEDYTGHYASEEYQDLWESINGPGSWDANPWVWVVEFKRLEQPT